MNSFISAILGAVTLAAIYGIYLAVRKTWQLLDGVVKSAAQVPELIKAINELVQVGRLVVSVIEALHAAMLGGQGQQSGEQTPDAMATTRRPLPAFPGAPPVYAPDATIEDTEIVDTTDEEYADFEKVDDVRGRGYSVEQDESIAVQPPGITKEA